MNTPATLVQRAIARCVDMVVLLLLIVGALARFVVEDADGRTPDVVWWWVALVVVGVVAYEIVPVHLRGQTPGKILTHIRVVNADTGENPSWRRAFVRWIVPVVIMLGLLPVLKAVVFPLLAVLYGTALLDRGNRSLLDKLANTRVVQAK